jgi:hypothetical protein
MNLNQLADQCEQATAEQQRELLGRAFNALNPAPHTSMSDLSKHAAKALRFRRMLDAEAYLDAAMMFCDGGIVKVQMHPDLAKAYAEYYPPADLDGDGFRARSKDTTPALALTAASLRARG